MKAAITTMALILSVASPVFAAGPDGDEKTFFPDQRSSDIDNKSPRTTAAPPASIDTERVKDSTISEPRDRMGKENKDPALDESSQDWGEKPFFPPEPK